MELLILALRIVLIGVLLVSGVAKLYDREGSKEAMRGFGVPERLIPAGAMALPWVEMLLALGLVFAPTLPWAAMLIALMFLVFALAMVRVARSGEQMECHCFGQLSSAPVSWKTVGRNAALTAIAVIVWLYAALKTSTHLWEPVSSDVMLATLGIGIVAALGYVSWQIQRLSVKVDALALNPQSAADVAPPVEVVKEQSFARIFAGVKVRDAAGAQISLPRLHTRRRPTLLIFVSNTCPACVALFPDVPKWQAEYAQALQIIVLGLGDAEDLAAKADAHGIRTMYYSEWSAISDIYPLRGVPTGVLVDRDGFIRQEHGLGSGGIRALIEGLADARAAEALSA